MFPPDAPLPKGAGEESFVSHQVVLQYLEDYAKNVRHLIKFNSKVQKVERRGNKWMIRTKTEDNVKESFFDIVFVCNGHYFKPSYPALKNQFKRKTLHSHNYRRPQEFTGETVAIVGAGFSGTDIALQLAENAKKVYMLHRKAPQFTDLPSNIIECQALKDITPDGESLLLQDNSTLDDVETVIFCTGYDYEFPFFCEDVIRVTENGKVVSPLCLHMLHTTYSNSLFFIGLPFYSLPFLLADYQVKFALSVVKGTAEVSEEKLQNYETERMLHVLEKYGSKAKFHQIGSEMFDLLREYARRGRFEDIIDYSKAQKMSTHLGKQREANLVGYKTEPYSLFE
ncbi:hypothetical protein L596_008661 [Steinernema carpocapsae]|uniref:Flavin-containing monooxygenase n=1 Tax=Steinernema carpocapsae TaxID=34508 RepID=A0A4U5PDZ5_STECR|nr:hypothetical protein L596_008661 [Steinernema carpocapsae]